MAASSAAVWSGRVRVSFCIVGAPRLAGLRCVGGWGQPKGCVALTAARRHFAGHGKKLSRFEVRLPEGLHPELEDLSCAIGVSSAALTRLALADWLARRGRHGAGRRGSGIVSGASRKTEEQI